MGNRVVSIITVVCLVIVFLFGFFVGKGKKEVIEKTVVQTDTVYIKQPPKIVYKTAVISKVDTLIKIDTVMVRDTVRIAYADTSFKEGDLKVWYYFPPVNRFKFLWQAYPQKVITITKMKTIQIKPRWYENKYLWGLAGLCLGIAITR